MNGLPFYTMPFVEGQSLRARLARDGAFPVTDAISVMRDVARALAYAHERGVVHRDIKPENILQSGGAAVVTDFGIAKAISAARTSSDTREHGDGTECGWTREGTSLGTPAYMAPEQAAADPATDHRADLYALGGVAYELLTGASPFAGRAPAQLLAAHLAEAPQPVREKRAEVPAALADLVMRCLAKVTAERPATARDLLVLLEVVNMPNASAGPAAPVAVAIGSGQAPSRGRLAAFVAVCVLLAGAAGWWQLRRSTNASSAGSHADCHTVGAGARRVDSARRRPYRSNAER